MDAQLNLLRKLQEYDLEIQSIVQKNDQLRDELDEQVAIAERLSEQLEGQKSKLDEARSLMRDKEMELTENMERYNDSKAKLNAVANTKQYNALEKEMDTLKKIRAQLEEERDTLAENIEGYEEDVKDKESKSQQMQALIDEERSEIEKATKDTDKRAKELEKERNKLRTDLPKRLVRRYEFILSRRPGAAVVPCVEGVCTGCNMTVPPQLFNELQRAQDIHQCPNCQRILYFMTPDELNAASA